MILCDKRYNDMIELLNNYPYWFYVHSGHTCIHIHYIQIRHVRIMYYIEILGSHLKTRIIMFRFHCTCSLSDYSVAGIRLSVLARSIGCTRSIKEDFAGRPSDDRAPLIYMMEDWRTEKLIYILSRTKYGYRFGYVCQLSGGGENSTINDGSNWSHASRTK